MKNCVYRFINIKGDIIYIGKAKDLHKRMDNHNHLPDECYAEKVRVEYCKFNTEDDIDLAERYYISKLKPKYNIIHSSKNISIDIEELNNMDWHMLPMSKEDCLMRIGKLAQIGCFDFKFKCNWLEINSIMNINKVILDLLESPKWTDIDMKICNLETDIWKENDKYNQLLLEELKVQFPYIIFDECNIDLYGKNIFSYDDLDDDKYLSVNLTSKQVTLPTMKIYIEDVA